MESLLPLLDMAFDLSIRRRVIRRRALVTNAILSTELTEEFRSKLGSVATDQSLGYSEDRYELQQTVSGMLGCFVVVLVS